MAAAIAGMLVLSSCIKFERQEMSYRYDKASDELRIFQVYYGIQGDAAELTPEEIKQMDSVLDGQRTFFFANWIFEYNRAQLEQMLVEGEKASKATPPPAAEELARFAAAKPLVELLIANVHVTNGQCFRDGERELCGYQQVTLSHVSTVIAQANTTINAMVLALPPEAEDPAKAALVSGFQAAARTGWTWIARSGNALTVRVPMAYAGYRQLRQTKAAELKAALGLPADPLAFDRARATFLPIVALLASEVDAGYIDHALQVTLGHPGPEPVTLDLPVNLGTYTEGAATYLRPKVGIYDVDLAKVRSDFLTPPAAPATP